MSDALVFASGVPDFVAAAKEMPCHHLALVATRTCIPGYKEIITNR